MDQIRIEQLEVFAKHGAIPEENVLGQKFLVSAVLHTDTRKAGRSDQLDQTISYGRASKFMERFLREHTFQLIESAAEQLAEELLLMYPDSLKTVELEIRKPWAPIGLPLQYVSVRIARGWHQAYIALGSNMGDRMAYLTGAVDGIKKLRECRAGRVSGFIETPPYGVTDQADFLNGCMEIQTLLTPEELLDALHEIEAAAGRERIIHWGPRTLDLDILFYDDLVYESEHLCIPHAEMHKRDFVLKPLAEIAPYKRHPIYGETAAEMLACVQAGGRNDF
ncbi:2-amino-4-hydroxy-6-hydroxymethyldihydropteridine diphosphokinase [Enterocloster bolteae]|jgi:dihydroneopterin aldolase/2-amino-4-hydroxy-6-hydroxymethyldihydropteridine diphosphokinase|uniref:2-amino-4-hydroxy-6- hydroxymethyldihydropteridine diphosphokinase n=1 Tax=Clostridia TaxID=186801 RepID=UPI001106CBC9|nr:MULTISPECIES: 2-amino-4-hydroxy-6-hydroxymethyldihydropteridine diphosphokinase [Clostridia]MCB7092610.1 2-amino-4-hydroxy-6-hydroxymethyldihydropteridine diphosphokinase [Enterocloster bolteae]MCH1935322.1 2-amino-4-hydroxy-6-hydroxymethyldihydropteridine diphosphokinase [Enterocloster sp. OA11]